MRIQNIGRNRWRVVVKRRTSAPGEYPYIDKVIHGSKQDAMDFEIAAGQNSSWSDAKITLGGYLMNQWLPSLVISESAIDDYRYGVGYLLPLHNTPLCDLKPVDIEKTIHAMPAGSRRRRARKTLSAALNTAVRWGLLSANPLSRATITIGTGNKRAYETYTASELDEVLRAFCGHVAESVVLLMAFCGLRKEEALALDWEDINTDTGEISITKAWARQGSTVIIKETKTAGSLRTVYAYGYALERLNTIKSAGNGIGAIWSGKARKRVRPDAALRTYQRHLMSLGLRYIPISMLRHTHATIALSSGIDVGVVSKGLGHSRISTTVNAYVRPLEEARKGAAEVFAKIMAENQTQVRPKNLPKTMVKKGKNGVKV